jgi:hypothetical protein
MRVFHPGPKVPQVIAPGFFLASAIGSCRVFAASDGLAMSTLERVDCRRVTFISA